MEKRNCDKIREIYIRNGLTYKKMSEITGIRQNTIACWVTGRRNPPDHTVEFVRAKVNCYIRNKREVKNE
ncbi:MAG: helix-turn-helix domain-containing protein [Lachnospiraceae bacterium]|nr:helix-turn-helix domain-containing protein [Lachnospiraceae bacterium]MCM1231559.1 helix-turn-helix domain-containing protein [Ruminococcus flavefaciens]